MATIYDEMSRYLFKKKFNKCTADEKSEITKQIQKALEFYKNKNLTKKDKILGDRFK